MPCSVPERKPTGASSLYPCRRPPTETPMDLIYSRPTSMATLEAQLRAYSDLSEKDAQRLASETFNGGPRVAPPITPPADWPHLDDKERRLTEYRIKRIERAINL